MNIKTIVLAAVLGMVGGLGASYLVMQHQLDSFQARLNKTPPIVVVDFAQLAQSYPEGATQEELDALMVQANEAILKLRDAGYLVLDSSAVAVAPEDVYLPVELIQ